MLLNRDILLDMLMSVIREAATADTDLLCSLVFRILMPFYDSDTGMVFIVGKVCIGPSAN
jgi:hypothetical protein